MRILIVEDDPIIVEGLKIALSQEGYEVQSFGDMKSSLKEIQKEVCFDACLLDVNLPDGDGFQICKAIREKSEVPVIFLTACDDEIHTVLAFEQGADDYIAKPYNLNTVVDTLNKYIQK